MASDQIAGPIAAENRGTIQTRVQPKAFMLNLTETTSISRVQSSLLHLVTASTSAGTRLISTGSSLTSIPRISAGTSNRASAENGAFPALRDSHKGHLQGRVLLNLT
jgi:hypothetical protein